MLASRCTLALIGPLPPGPQPALAPLARRFGELLLCTDEPERVLAVGVSAVAPLGPSPLGDVVAALTMAEHDAVLVARFSATSPATDLLEQLVAHDDRADVVLAGRGGLVPGLYRRRCARSLERALREGRLAPEEALRGLKVCTVPG